MNAFLPTTLHPLPDAPASAPNALSLRINRDDYGTKSPLEEWDGMWTLYRFDKDGGKLSECPWLRCLDSDSEATGRREGDWDYIPSLPLYSKFRAGLAWNVSISDYGYNLIARIVDNDPTTFTEETPHRGYYSNALLVWENKPGDMGAKSIEDRKQDAASDLSVYCQWANGEVYFFSLETEDGEHLDSCGGIYDEDWTYTASEYVAPAIRRYAESKKSILGHPAFDAVDVRQARHGIDEEDNDPRTLYVLCDEETFTGLGYNSDALKLIEKSLETA